MINRNMHCIEAILGDMLYTYTDDGSAAQLFLPTFSREHSPLHFVDMIIRPDEHGIVFSATAPMPLPEDTNEDKVLRFIADANCGKIRGKAVYKPEERTLMYVTATPLSESLEIDLETNELPEALDNELSACMEITRQELVELHAKLLKRLSEDESDLDADETERALDQLLTRLRARHEAHSDDETEDGDLSEALDALFADLQDGDADED